MWVNNCHVRVWGTIAYLWNCVNGYGFMHCLVSLSLLISLTVAYFFFQNWTRWIYLFPLLLYCNWKKEKNFALNLVRYSMDLSLCSNFLLISFGLDISWWPLNELMAMKIIDSFVVLFPSWLCYTEPFSLIFKVFKLVSSTYLCWSYPLFSTCMSPTSLNLFHPNGNVYVWQILYIANWFGCTFGCAY